jgi:hypothetical protein
MILHKYRLKSTKIDFNNGVFSGINGVFAGINGAFMAYSHGIPQKIQNNQKFPAMLFLKELISCMLFFVGFANYPINRG